MPDPVTCGCGVRYDADTQSSACPHHPLPSHALKPSVPPLAAPALSAGVGSATLELPPGANIRLDALSAGERKARESLRGVKVMSNTRLTSLQLAAVAVCMEALDRVAPRPTAPPAPPAEPPAANATTPEAPPA